MNYDLVLYLTASQPVSDTHAMIGPASPTAIDESRIYIAMVCHSADAPRDTLVCIETLNDLYRLFPDVEHKPFNSGYLTAHGVLSAGGSVQALFVAHDDAVYKASYRVMTEALARRIHAHEEDERFKKPLRRIVSSSKYHKVVR